MDKLKYDKELERLGLKIKELRRERNITQEVLSSMCDLDVRTIQRIEKGQQNITLSVLFDLGKSLNINPEELIKHCNI